MMQQETVHVTFYLDDRFYECKATLHYYDLMLWFDVVLMGSTNFTLFMGDEWTWESDCEIEPGLINAIGSEVERNDNSFEGIDLLPGNYFSE